MIRVVFIFSLIFITLFFGTSCSKNRPKSPVKLVQVNKEIDDYISSLIRADEIPGMALAIVKGGKIIHKKYYGLANIAHKVPVSDSTLFRLYSTTKLITAVASFQLIEDGKLSLDDPISKYIKNLPESWESIKIKHLLTCSSGLPDYKDFDKKLSDKEVFNELTKQSLNFEKGYRYEYSQTNYWFLQLIIEKITNQRFEDFVKENQFKNRKNEVLFASNSLVDYPNRVSKYQYNKEYNAYEKTTYEDGNRSLAGNGLNTNLNTLLDWNMKLDNNQLIELETMRLMMSPFKYEKNDFPFGYTWGIYGPEGKQYYGFAGGGVSAFMKFIDKDLTIIILSNGFKSKPIIANAVTYISGLMDEGLVRKDRMLNEDIRLNFILNDYKKAVELYHRTKQDNQDSNFERGLNNVGYYYLSNNQIEKSIAIFKLYTQEYPDSSNAFDSLGEAYFNNEQYDLSKTNYKKSLELDPNNENAEKMLKKIEQITNANTGYN
ncbi:MAG: serine hydrolase [Thermonemataceae bacterium]